MGWPAWTSGGGGEAAAAVVTIRARTAPRLARAAALIPWRMRSVSGTGLQRPSSGPAGANRQLNSLKGALQRDVARWKL